MNNKLFLIFFCFLLNTSNLISQELAVLKYEGGGDWYSNPTSLKNLIKFCNDNLSTKINLEPKVVDSNDPKIFDYPMIFMTGHGNVFFSNESVKNLRTYLFSGGFLHIDDNYGMKPYLLPQIKKLFPNKELKEIPLNHPIFQGWFKFPSKGLLLYKKSICLQEVLQDIYLPVIGKSLWKLPICQNMFGWL